MEAKKLLVLETIVKALNLSDKEVRAWAENRPVQAPSSPLDELLGAGILTDAASALVKHASKTVSQTKNGWNGH